MAGQSWNINKVQGGITQAEFQKLLENSVLNTGQEEIVASIFSQLSKGDGVLSEEDWNNFLNAVNTNDDKKITDAELTNSVNKSKQGIFANLVEGKNAITKAKDALINFYNMVSKYIQKNLGIISQNVATAIESFNGKAISVTKGEKRDTVLVEYENDNDENIVVAYDNKTGKPITITTKKSDGEITQFERYIDGNLAEKRNFTENGAKVSRYNNGNIVSEEEINTETNERIVTEYKNSEEKTISTYNEQGLVRTEEYYKDGFKIVPKITEYKNGNITKVTSDGWTEIYIDGKTSEEISDSMMEILDELSKDKKYRKAKDLNKDLMLLEKAVNSEMTLHQIEDFFGKEYFQELLFAAPSSNYAVDYLLEEHRNGNYDKNFYKDFLNNYKEHQNKDRKIADVNLTAVGGAVNGILKQIPSDLFEDKKLASEFNTDLKNLRTNLLSNLRQSVNSEMETEEIFYVAINNNRNKKIYTSGNFTDGWIAHDKYNSGTFEEWLSNNGYEYNAAAGKKMAEIGNKYGQEANKRRKREKASGIKPSWKCAGATHGVLRDTSAVNPGVGKYQDRRNLSAKDSMYFEMHGVDSAFQYASQLANNPNFKELPHNIVASMDLTTLPAGCVIVFDAGYRTNGKHEHGHIAVTDGKGYMQGDVPNESIKKSDYVKDVQKTHVRVFVPIIRNA